MQNYPRRGYFPDDAESAYKRWRDSAAAAVFSTFPNADAVGLEQLIRAVWLAGWHTRGYVSYGLPDELSKD